MSATLELRCSNCNDPILEYANTTARLGRCCVNLPQSWSVPGHHRGFVTAPADGEEAPTIMVPEDDEDESPTRWECPYCGCHEDVIIERTEVYVGRLEADRITDRLVDDAGDNQVPWWESSDTGYDDESSVSLCCDGCGSDVSRSFDRE